MSKFGQLLRIAADWDDFVESNDQGARSRLIHEGKPVIDQMVQELAAMLQSNDEEAFGMLLDKLRMKAAQTTFFGKGPL